MLSFGIVFLNPKSPDSRMNRFFCCEYTFTRPPLSIEFDPEALVREDGSVNYLATSSDRRKRGYTAKKAA